MKAYEKQSVRWLMFTLLAVLAMYFLAAGRASAQDYTLEPNGNWVNGEIAEKGEANWHKLTLPIDAHLVLTYQAEGLGYSDVSLMNEDKAISIGTGSCKGATAKNPKSAVLDLWLEAGVYQVKVAAGFVAFPKPEDITGTYRLNAKYTPAGNKDREPNNVIETAMPLEMNKGITGMISGADNVDLYRITVPYKQDVEINVTVMFPPRTLRDDSYGGAMSALWDANMKALKETAGNIPGGNAFRGATESSPKTWTVKENLAAGTYYIKVEGFNGGQGRYNVSWKGEKQKETAVTVKKMSKPKLKRAGSRKLKVSWKKQKGVSGYQIQYGTKSNMKGAKKKTVNSGTKLTLSRLKKGKTYYVRICAFLKKGTKKYYGKWSAVSKIKVK